MPTIAITGGIASGKSSFRRSLLDRLSAEFFNTDTCARELLEGDPAIRNEIVAAFSPRAYSEDGTANRPFLREIVFSDEARRKQLEAILQPMIRQRWTDAASRATRPFFVEIPLLFETEAGDLFDRIISVACSEKTQIKRLVTNRKIDPSMARKILASQLGLDVKIARSDHVVWNDGPPSLLESQADLLASLLNSQYD